jgi:CRISPR system Cascade subunit CasD
MTAVLVLRLAGPLQAWGSRSRFVRRETEQSPTKSGVIGLLAAARGLRRTEDLTEFFGLRFGVRTDQPGRLIRDFQTARSLDGQRTMPLSYRYYLADAVFVAAVAGDRALLEGLEEAVRRPHFPLYLGRRSCPPVGPVNLGLRSAELREVLQQEPWQAARWHRRRVDSDRVTVPVTRDAEPGEAKETETWRDEPLSFDPRRREYGWRAVVREQVSLSHPDPPAVRGHDPLAVLGG